MELSSILVVQIVIDIFPTDLKSRSRVGDF